MIHALGAVVIVGSNLIVDVGRRIGARGKILRVLASTTEESPILAPQRTISQSNQSLRSSLDELN